MKIGLTTSLAQRGRSGIGQYLVNLVAALVRQAPQDEFVVFALEADAELFHFAGDAVQLVIVGHGRRTPGPDVMWHQFTLPRLAEEHGLDVLHVPSHRRMLWRRPCALVTTVTDVGAFRAPRDPTGRGSCPAAVFRSLARRQDEIVTPTRHVASELIELTGLPPQRVTPVPVGVDHRRFSPGDVSEAAAYVAHRHALHPPFFLSVARLDERAHAHAQLIEAFNAFKTAAPSPWQLVFLGADGSGADRIREHVLRSPYAPDIHCLGHVAPDEMPRWYRAAGALVYAPRRWGFCLPLNEAMACGCPVLTVAAPAARELCQSAAMYADGHDRAALQANLTLLAADAPLRTRLGRAGLERARRLDWTATAGAMLEVYARAARRVGTTVVVPGALTTPAH